MMPGFVGGWAIDRRGSGDRARTRVRARTVARVARGGSSGPSDAGRGGFGGRGGRGAVVWWREGCSGNARALQRALAASAGAEVHCVVRGSREVESITPGVVLHRARTRGDLSGAVLRACRTAGVTEVHYVQDPSARGLVDEIELAASLRAHSIALVRAGAGRPSGVELAVAGAAIAPLITERLENGQSIQYESIDGDLSQIVQADTRSLEQKFRDFIYRVYLPDGYPNSVTSDYLRFTQWRVLQNIASSVMAVISTEALLFGLGIGKKGSAVAAATSWVLKDGLGYMGKVLYGFLAGSQFDSDPKSWRVASDAVEDAGGVLELLTPLFPGNFLLLASIANMMKGVASMTGTATRHAIYKSLALADNQGDIATKGESQGVTCKMVGLGLGIGISAAIGQNYPVLLGAYGSFAVVHLAANWQSMSCVQFASLNRQRGSVVVEAFLAGDKLPSPYDVSHTERVVLPPWRMFSREVVLGASVAEALPTTTALSSAKTTFKKSRYMAGARNGKVYCVFREDATSNDVLEAYLMGHRFKHNGNDVNEAAEYAKKNIAKFLSSVKKAGWSTSSSAFLLNVGKTRAIW